MTYARQFREALQKAMDRRTDSMIRMILGGHGVPKKFNKAVRNKLRDEILNCASSILIRDGAQEEFKLLIKTRRLRHISGHGVWHRFNSLYDWARQHVRGPIVYAFWRRKRCLYIGKGSSYRRLKAYKKSYYLKEAHSLEIWEIVSKSKLPSAECLALHLFVGNKKNDNRARPARVKWGAKCPICKRHDAFKKEVDSLLRLKA